MREGKVPRSGRPCNVDVATAVQGDRTPSILTTSAHIGGEHHRALRIQLGDKCLPRTDSGIVELALRLQCMPDRKILISYLSRDISVSSLINRNGAGFVCVSTRQRNEVQQLRAVRRKVCDERLPSTWAPLPDIDLIRVGERYACDVETAVGADRRSVDSVCGIAEVG